MPDLDEDILRQLMLRSTDDLFAPPAAAATAIRRQRRLRVRKRVLSAAGTAAAAGLAVGVMASASGKSGPGGVRLQQGDPTGPTAPIRLTAAQQVLFNLSAAAAKTPRPSGRYVVLNEQATTTDSASGVKTSEVGGKTSVIDTITGGGVTYQDITVSGAGVPPVPRVLNAAPGTSPTVAQLDAMPTDPVKLRAALLAQAKQQQRQAQQFFEQKIKKLGAEGKKLKTPQGPQETSDDLVFEQAADLLWEPDLSPQLRSALYKVLAATPGVTVKTGTADSSGRPATEISRVDSVAGENVETFEDPATGATLESAWDNPAGEFDEDLYQSATYTNTIPPDPYQG